MNRPWPLLENDPWSTPFTQVLLGHLDVFSCVKISFKLIRGTSGKYVNFSRDINFLQTVILGFK